MGTATWPLLTDPITPQLAVSAPVDPGAAQVTGESLLGHGMIRPLRRDQKGDFAHASGGRLVSACVGQVLGTMCDSEFATGELPWRTTFGSKTYLLRQRLNSPALEEQARKFIADALRLWEPRVRLKNVRITRENAPTGGTLNVLRMRARYDFVDRNSGPNAVLMPDIETEVLLRG